MSTWRWRMGAAWSGGDGWRGEPRLTVRGLETRDELVHGRVDGHHPCLRGRNRTGRGQPFLPIDRGERGDASAALTGAIRRSTGGAGWWSALAALTSGASPEPREFVLGAARHHIAIGFTSLEHMPGEGDQLAGRRHNRDVPVFAVLKLAYKGAKRAGVAAQMLPSAKRLARQL